MDPEGLDPNVGQSLLNMAGNRVSQDNSQRKVQARLRGEDAIITTDDDKSAMQKMVQIGVINDTGQVTNAGAFAAVAGKLNYIPRDIVRQINAGSASDQVDDLAQAANLYFHLDSIAPAAVTQYLDLDDTARTRLETIAGELEQGPNQLTDDGKPNPEYQKFLQQQARRALNISRERTADVDEGTKRRTFAGVDSTAQIPKAIDEILRQSLPKHLQRRNRTLLGMDFLFPDKTISLDDVPPNFRATFRDKAAEAYAQLTASGAATGDTAREMASRQALKAMRSDFVFAVHNDHLFVLPRHNNPAHIDWTPTATQEWEEMAEELQGGELVAINPNDPDNIMVDIDPMGGPIGPSTTFERPNEPKIDSDIDINEYRPKTVPGRAGYAFVHVDDPLNYLTYREGQIPPAQQAQGDNRVFFRPSTPPEIIQQRRQESAEQTAEGAERTSAREARRIKRQKLKLVEWAIENQIRRDRGDNYDRRLESVEKKLSPANYAWYFANRDATLLSNFLGFTPDPQEFDVEPQEPDIKQKPAYLEIEMPEIQQLPAYTEIEITRTQLMIMAAQGDEEAQRRLDEMNP
jgi:hypothetical protein